LFGSVEARQEIADIVRSVLEMPRDPAKLRADVLDMRGTMAEHKVPSGPLDIKLLRGGLVDIEFIVHFLQLRDHQALTPGLGLALRELAGAGVLPESMVTSHDTMLRLLVVSRLLAPDGQVPPLAAQAALAKACGCSDWKALLANLADARRIVAEVWHEVFAQKLEIKP
jgi:[glutamine synthetase] adenylyltransferase / [glutamine synthetase]-adenylyl-L-tyrosine phosphorylase